MSLPTTATFCDLSHPPIAFLGEACPLCRYKGALSNNGVWPPKLSTVWPFTNQLQSVLQRQFTPKVSETELLALFTEP